MGGGVGEKTKKSSFKRKWQGKKFMQKEGPIVTFLESLIFNIRGTES